MIAPKKVTPLRLKKMVSNLFKCTTSVIILYLGVLISSFYLADLTLQATKDLIRFGGIAKGAVGVQVENSVVYIVFNFIF